MIDSSSETLWPPTEKKSQRLRSTKRGVNRTALTKKPISLLASIILEHLLYSQLTTHLREHNLQNEHQWGLDPQDQQNMCYLI